MYTVSIFSQTAQSWRTLTVKTLSECVQLTLGLETAFRVTSVDMESVSRQQSVNLPPDEIIWASRYKSTLTEYSTRYAHSLRALVQRWKRNDFHPVSWFRMSDSALWNEHTVPQWLKNYDSIDQ